MLAAEIIGITLLLTAVCLLVGSMVCEVLNLGNDLSLRITAGFISVLAVLQISATPFMILKGKFSAFFILFFAILTVLLILSIFYIRKKAIDFSGVFVFKSHTFLWMLAFAVIGFQIVMCALLQHTDDDDAFYITAAASALKSNIICGVDPSSGILSTSFPLKYGLVGWELYIAFLSKLFAFPPAVFAHSVIQPFLILISYLAFYCVAKRIVKNKNAIPCFMLITAVIYLFGSYSSYTQASFLLLRIWQGKAVLVNIVFSVLIAVCIEIYNHVNDKNSRLWIFVSIVMLAGCGASVMGDYLTPLLYVSVMLPLAFCIPFEKTVKSFPPLLLSLIPCIAYTIANLCVTNLFSSSETAPVSYDFIVKQFCGPHYLFAILFLLSLIYILFKGKKLQRALLCGSTLFLILTLLNPIIGSFFLHKDAFSSVYWRLFWLLPVYSAIAFAASDLIAKVKSPGYTAALAAMLCVIVFSGKYMFSKEFFSIPQNAYKLPETVIDIANCIEQDNNGKSTVVFVPEDISAKLRQYDTNLNLVWSRKAYLPQNFSYSDSNQLCRFYDSLYLNKKISSSELAYYMKKFNLTYLVATEDCTIDSLKLIKNINGFKIYKY